MAATDFSPEPVRLHVGVKSDPIEYRYTFPWLFRLMADCGVHHLQIGTFFELYNLPDAFFLDLRAEAERSGIHIRSVFTSHRELGGFYRQETGWEQTARQNYERLIEVAALVGADSAGTNPGSVPRDRMDWKRAGVRTYVRHMKELMTFARERGLRFLALEPMSCLAEPPALPEEIHAIMAELREHHRNNPDTTAGVGVCADVSHGYADETGKVIFDHMTLLREALPYVTEVHLKNTDAHYCATFGFSAEERKRGVVDLGAVSALLRAGQAQLPVRELVGYLEIGGPKTGRDYSDRLLEGTLRESLAHCREAFAGDGPVQEPSATVNESSRSPAARVLLSPSLMCADALHLGEAVTELQGAGADLLHLDIMDARFTPNMPVGLGAVEALARVARVPLDAHLMVTDHDFFVEALARMGVGWISVHVETARHLDRTLARIRDLGMKAGAALNPATPLDTIRHVLDRLDFVLIMTVNPGFAGQSLVPATLQKIAHCRQMLERAGRSVPIQVDGNVSFENIPAMVARGADILVCGSSSIFAPGSIRTNTARVRRLAEKGLQLRKGLSLSPSR